MIRAYVALIFSISIAQSRNLARHRTITQPCNTTITQPCNTTITQPCNATITQPCNATITQQNNHATLHATEQSRNLATQQSRNLATQQSRNLATQQSRNLARNRTITQPCNATITQPYLRLSKEVVSLEAAGDNGDKVLQLDVSGQLRVAKEVVTHPAGEHLTTGNVGQGEFVILLANVFFIGLVLTATMIFGSGVSARILTSSEIKIKTLARIQWLERSERSHICVPKV
jgi:hypothetical protein